MNAEADTGLLLLLKKEGFVYGSQILAARTVAKLGLPVACAMLMVESGGGQNIFGHDTDALGECPGYGWGLVTQAKYLAFKAIRVKTGRSNGVGCAQLTSPGLQDEADAAGGCWVPQHNMAVGFHTLHDDIDQFGLQDGCAAYNGGAGGRNLPGPQAYGAHLVALAEHYKSIGLGTVVGNLP